MKINIKQKYHTKNPELILTATLEVFSPVGSESIFKAKSPNINVIMLSKNLKSFSFSVFIIVRKKVIFASQAKPALKFSPENPNQSKAKQIIPKKVESLKAGRNREIV